MKLKFLKVTLVGLVLSVSCLVNVASAGFITFNDRISFENYLSGFTLDNLNTLTTSGPTSSLTFDDFSVSGSMYGCVNGGGCNSSSGPYNNLEEDYVWTYETVNFAFNSAIVAFGFDFDSYSSKTDNLDFIATLNGFSSLGTNTGGFFGIATDDGSTFSNVSYAKNLGFGLFDNVTYASSINNVPEPSTLAIFGLGLMGLGYRRFKKN